jgi:hypothetical protein
MKAILFLLFITSIFAAPSAPKSQAKLETSAIAEMQAKLEELSARLDTVSGSGSSLPTDQNVMANPHTGLCGYDSIPDYVCPPGSVTCAYFANAWTNNACVNITVDYTLAPWMQTAGIADRQRDRTADRGRPATLSNIPTGMVMEAVFTPWALGNASPNTVPPYHANGSFAQLAGQNFAWWSSLMNARTNTSGGNGIWIGYVKIQAHNDLLMSNCDAITKTFLTANPVQAVVGEYNAPGCPVIFPDSTGTSMNEYGGPNYDFGQIDIFTRSPPFIASTPHYWDELSSIAASTKVFFKWKCTGSVHLHTRSDSGSYVYELCPRFNAARTVPPPYNN